MPEIKSFPFPVLSPDSMDYAAGEYEAGIARTDNGGVVVVRHHLHGENLIARLLQEGKAAFACIVSLPTTMYRRVFVSDTAATTDRQQINYSEAGHGLREFAVESPMFRPIVLVKETIEKTVSDGDGLDSLWSDAAVSIPEGGIIAYGDWQRFRGAMGGLLVVNRDNALPKGEMRIRPDHDGGFRFQVFVDEHLFKNLDTPPDGHGGHRRSVLTHALSDGFRLLQKDFSDNWKDYTNLRLVADKLAQSGIAHWGDEEFSPAEAATRLYPHIFAETGEDGGDD